MRGLSTEKCVARSLVFAAGFLAATSAWASDDPTKKFAAEENTAEEVTVHGASWPSPRGVGDTRVKRDVIDAAPHMQTSEMLSAAPGFFVDHEDGEGFGNDVFYRGFDSEHGAGLELRLGSVPINVPSHVQGQGYADTNFIIPELVRGVRVLGGPFDPRQGDTALVGSAYFDLGVVERGSQLKTTFGSFDQVRVMGIVAPRGLDEDTFAAFAVRRTNGFGENREGHSATVNAQYGVDLGADDHLRVLVAGYDVHSALPGVVRQDDVDTGRIGFYDTYPSGNGQSVHASRFVLGVDVDHLTRHSAHLDIEPWFMWTDFRARQNFTGSITSPSGDFHQTTTTESALGFTARYHPAPLALGQVAELVIEPGLIARAGHTDETHDLAATRLLDASVLTFDVGSYVDLDLRIAKRLRISGGVRADLLMDALDVRTATDAFVGPRATVELEVARDLAVSASYGEGFRSRDAATLGPTDSTYTRVRSVEVGMRMQDKKKRWTTSLALFDTFVDEELVFDADSGKLERSGASTRRGLVGSLLARPTLWLLVSTSLSVNNAIFTTPGDDRFVPSVPPILFRADASARHAIARIHGELVVGHVGVGYTYVAPRHITGAVVGAEAHALNATIGARWAWLELAVEGYNLLGLKYADDAQVYASNWSSQPATVATHMSAAAPTTLLGTVALHF